MEYLSLFIKVALVVSILNVWLLRRNRPTIWRGGNANNMLEEFVNYGLPNWMVMFVGITKIFLAILLILSFWYPVLLLPASLSIGIFMLGAVIMHLKIKDPLIKSLPATALLLLSITLVILDSSTTH